MSIVPLWQRASHPDHPWDCPACRLSMEGPPPGLPEPDTTAYTWSPGRPVERSEDPCGAGPVEVRNSSDEGAA